MSGRESSTHVLVDLCDAELVAACLEGRAWAWDAIIERYKRLVYAIPMQADLSQEDAADVFQTVFAALRESEGLAMSTKSSAHGDPAPTAETLEPASQEVLPMPSMDLNPTVAQKIVQIALATATPRPNPSPLSEPDWQGLTVLQGGLRGIAWDHVMLDVPPTVRAASASPMMARPTCGAIWGGSLRRW
jgi:hypothetical protein